MTTPTQYVPLKTVEHSPPADRDSDDLSRQSLINNKQPPKDSRSGSPPDRAPDGSIDEEEVDLVREAQPLGTGSVLTSSFLAAHLSTYHGSNRNGFPVDR